MRIGRLVIQEIIVKLQPLPSCWFLAILFTLPIILVAKEFSRQHGFLSLPRFGDDFRERAFPVVQENATFGKPGSDGYDGQFYAHIALDPSLKADGLDVACDSFAYRAKRIGLPFLAHWLGLRQPLWILQVYSVLNLLFWFAFAALILRTVGTTSLESQWTCLAILWSAGVIISISRALTDLPALAISFFAMTLAVRHSSIAVDFRGLYEAMPSRLDETRIDENEKRYDKGSLSPKLPKFNSRAVDAVSSIVLGLAALTKETSILSVGSLLDWANRKSLGRNVALCILAGLPMLSWWIYVRFTAGPDKSGMVNFSYPLYGFVHKLSIVLHNAWHEFPRLPLLEFIGPISIAVQVAGMIRFVDLKSRFWWFGLGHTILALFIADPVWATQSAYGRCLLPMTVAFNLLLFQANVSTRTRLKWYWLGNIGLLDRAIPGLAIIWLVSLAISRFERSSTT